jgi:hypothetical protein
MVIVMVAVVMVMVAKMTRISAPWSGKMYTARYRNLF